MAHHERIQLADTAMSAIAKLAENNPGAVKVCCQLFKEAAAIDPCGALGGIAPLLDFDRMGIYGSSIWVAYKDVAGENLSHLLAILRWIQLGIGEERVFLDAIRHEKAMDCAPILKAVQERLPGFAQQSKVLA